MLNLSKKLVILTSVVSVGHGIVNGAMGMESPTGMRNQSNGSSEGEMFIKDNDSRIFLITDIINPQKYAIYPTDKNEYLTIQEVPGDGKCGDFAMGISREALIARFETAIKLGAVNTELLDLSYELERLKVGDSLEIGHDSCVEAQNEMISNTIQLAACLFKLNVEVYYPDYDSLGMMFFHNGKQCRPINKIKLHYKATYDNNNGSVIRLIHMGRLDGFRRTGGSHFNYLYNQNNLQPWEKKKVDLLQEAVEYKVKMNTVGYESKCQEIVNIQEEGLKNSPIDVTQVNNGYHEHLAEYLSGYVKTGSSNECLMNMLRDNGVGDDISACKKIIELAKIKANSSNNQEAARQEAARQEAARRVMDNSDFASAVDIEKQMQMAIAASLGQEIDDIDQFGINEINPLVVRGATDAEMVDMLMNIYGFDKTRSDRVIAIAKVMFG